MIGKALLIKDQGHNKFEKVIKNIEFNEIKETEVLIKVEYSSINFKDSLALQKPQTIIKKFPMIPGIDLAGTIISSKSKLYNKGDKVLVTGFGIGEKYWGGFSELSIINEKFIVKLPPSMTTKKAMCIGTAGFTAMLAIESLLSFGVPPNDSKIVVTGATGGVGLFAIYILSNLGYSVVASTGKMKEKNLLIDVGASDVIDRNTLNIEAKPLEGQTWDGCIDSLGGKTLAKIFSCMKYNGVIASCGMAENFYFNTTVGPLILRGVKLIGIDSVYFNIEKRLAVWNKYEKMIEEHFLEKITKEINLEEVLGYSEGLTKGTNKGRILVKLS